uniref:Craniofacial development protein 2-like n=2 Tax=Nicotiana TaxID=4085 RepID=A0A1S4BA64_TOBAC|nr:PREDICTED: craniofacial development protein 2-like [Nicotiana sylvestris]XP_016485795.1 PREDICTED: craniofacial development protein 2-like [Nicotiana tabacum]
MQTGINFGTQEPRKCTLNVVSAYAPHAGLDEEVKQCFWEGLDKIIRQVPPAEKLFIGGDFNGHIGATASGYDEVHGGFGFRERNGGRTSLLDFAKAFRLVIANSIFPKREEHLVTFRPGDGCVNTQHSRGCAMDKDGIPGV